MTDRKSSSLEALRPWLRVAIPVLILVVGFFVAEWIAASREAPETTAPPVFAPLVEVIELQPGAARLDVRANGTTRARTATTLVSEVNAKVTSVSPSLEPGAFFERGEVLVEFERRDYELALVQAESRVADAELALSREEAEAESAIEEWEANTDEPAPDLVRRVPQLASARAAVRAAKAAIDAAQLDLERTRVRAPYGGRVRTKSIDIGRYATVGSPLAEIYSTDDVDIRLPLHDRDLEFLDLPLAMHAATPPNGDTADHGGPPVTVRADFGGETRAWRGRIVRTEGEIGERSRMVYAIARVDDPYGPDAPPLLLGMFVEVTIEGRSYADCFEIPRDAIRGENTVLVVTPENALETRTLEILRTDGGVAYATAGVAAGERLCTTRLEVYADGMRVRVAGEEPSADETAEGTDR